MRREPNSEDDEMNNDIEEERNSFGLTREHARQSVLTYVGIFGLAATIIGGTWVLSSELNTISSTNHDAIAAQRQDFITAMSTLRQDFQTSLAAQRQDFQTAMSTIAIRVTTLETTEKDRGAEVDRLVLSQDRLGAALGEVTNAIGQMKVLNDDRPRRR